MDQQQSLFTGKQLRDVGMSQAEDHANQVHNDWSGDAYRFLNNYSPDGEFMAEEVRLAAIGIIPDPPSLRAWGPIMNRAARSGMIKRVGYRPVKNPRAHMAMCSVWIKS